MDRPAPESARRARAYRVAASWLAWGLWAFSVVLVALGVLLTPTGLVLSILAAISAFTGNLRRGAVGMAALRSSCGEDLPEVERGKLIVEEAELKPNSAFTFADAETGEARVLVRLPDGEFALHSAECTHRGCTVEYLPRQRELKCPCHGSTYDPRSGALFGGPADGPLKEFAVKVEGGKVVSA